MLILAMLNVFVSGGCNEFVHFYSSRPSKHIRPNKLSFFLSFFLSLSCSVKYLNNHLPRKYIGKHFFIHKFIFFLFINYSLYIYLSIYLSISFVLFLLRFKKLFRIDSFFLRWFPFFVFILYFFPSSACLYLFLYSTSPYTHSFLYFPLFYSFFLSILLSSKLINFIRYPFLVVHSFNLSFLSLSNKIHDLNISLSFPSFKQFIFHFSHFCFVLFIIDISFYNIRSFFFFFNLNFIWY
ncbi:unnamed protein product [Acanthosepion pharaonis]|uniref:Uncharacterized protein n=1 Tax=Acanthosepion pharaonis TaxID=158019 RepID=A0A812EZS4_ACAPH|nr:unnamed protein product [Sepia pharaonis]